MQVIGPPFGEERVLQLMRVIQDMNAIGLAEMVKPETE